MAYEQNDATFFPEREDENTFQEQELIVCEGGLTKKECLEALKDVGTEKTPGTDGYKNIYIYGYKNIYIYTILILSVTVFYCRGHPLD